MNAILNAASITGQIGAGSICLSDYLLEITPNAHGYRLSVTRGSEVQAMDIQDGVGVEKIEKTGSTGNADSYRITLTDGSTFDYSIETNEADRARAEAARADAEAGRAEAEAIRVEAENARVSAENARVDAETDRVNAETARAEAFSGYQGEIDQFKAEIVTGRDAATDNTRFAIGTAEESLEVPEMEEFNALNSNLDSLITRLKSGLITDAELHLGFYLDEDGDLCQKEV